MKDIQIFNIFNSNVQRVTKVAIDYHLALSKCSCEILYYNLLNSLRFYLQFYVLLFLRNIKNVITNVRWNTVLHFKNQLDKTIRAI